MQIRSQNLLKMALIFIGLSVHSLAAQNSVYLKIQSSGFKPIPLVIQPFQGNMSPELYQEWREILVNDLDLTDFFQVSAPAGLASDLKLSAAGALLESRIEARENNLIFSARLLDLPEKQPIFNKAFTTNSNAPRLLVHHIADEIVYQLIGEPGIATSRLACISQVGEAKELFLVDYDGFGLRQISNNGALNLSPAWSPDAKNIVFTTYKANNPDLVGLSLATGRLVSIFTENGLNSTPAWSPDGEKIAFTATRDGNAEIYLLNLKTNELQRLTNSLAIDSAPCWSPNGREIAFTSDRSGSPQIYIMAAEGGNVRRLTFSGNYNDAPDWSPKGDRIAFTSRVESYFQIFTIDVTGDALQPVTDGRGNHENPSWAPDGFRLAFASNREGEWAIFVANWDGSRLRRVTSRGRCVLPAWSPRANWR
ncbi:Tol-Pal system beta propeller repeat protein TolB [candidate division KSB1 bacterium]|nr:Tol-Pal system beta propeller repeat protein TolB [candidate division KSB1 bacterium]